MSYGGQLVEYVLVRNWQRYDGWVSDPAVRYRIGFDKPIVKIEPHYDGGGQSGMYIRGWLLFLGKQDDQEIRVIDWLKDCPSGSYNGIKWQVQVAEAPEFYYQR